MSHFKQILATTAVVAVLAAGELAIAPFASAETPMTDQVAAPTSAPMHMPATAAESTMDAAKYDQEALDLEAKAVHHAQMASYYRTLASGGSKQQESYRSIALHCKGLAEHYSKAAAEARAMAQAHRERAKGG